MLGRLLEVAEPLWDDRYWNPSPFARPTLAGPKVETQESLTLPAVFCGVNLLAGIMGSLPLPVLERISSRKQREVPDHAVHQLLNVEANPETTSSAFIRSHFLHTFLWGNGIEEIQRSGTDPVALWLSNPETTDVKRSKETKQLVYEFQRPDGGVDKLPGRNVLHPTGLGMDGIVGFGLIRHLARGNIGLALAISEYAQSYFGNSTMIGTMISFPNKMDPKALKNYAEEIEGRFSSEKKFSTLVTDNGATFSRMGAENSAAQTLELLIYSVQDVSRWTNIPPPFLMELSHATYSNIKELSSWLVRYTLNPWFKVFEQEYTRKLFTLEERKTLRVKYNAEGLLRGDPKTRSEFYEKMLRNGVFSINDVREKEDMNAIEGGDRHHIELNRTTLEDMAENGGGRRSRDRRGDRDRDPDEEADVDIMARMRATIAEAHKPLLHDAVDRMIRIQVRAAKRAYAKNSGGFSDWVGKFYTEHLIVFRDAVIPCFEALGGAIRGTLPTTILDAEWNTFVGERTKEFAVSFIGLLSHKIGEEGELFARLDTPEAALLLSIEDAARPDADVDSFIAEASRRFCAPKGEPSCN